MGDRRSVELMFSEGAPIYFYTHWYGTDLPKIVADALDSKQGRSRWDDESYLARIIFSKMIENDIKGETGFGISTYPPDENHPHVRLNFNDQTVDGLSFELFIASLNLVERRCNNGDG